MVFLDFLNSKYIYFLFEGKILSLLGGNTVSEGNVYIDGAPLCHRYGSWNWKNAAVVCRQLGYNYTVQITGNSYFGGVPDWYLYEMAYMYCNGKEGSISECGSYSGYKQTCTNSTGVGVVCSETPPSRTINV